VVLISGVLSNPAFPPGGWTRSTFWVVASVAVLTSEAGKSVPANVVVLGGGVGGLVAAVETKKSLGNRADVTLIDRKKHFQFPPSFPWVVTGFREPTQVQHPLGPLRSRGLDVFEAEVIGLDIRGKVVLTTSRSIPFDRLIIALGAEYAPELVPGYSQWAHHMYDLDSAVRMGEAVRSFSQGKILLGIARLPFKCPAAPYEMAFLLDDLYRRRGIRDRVELGLFSPEGNPLPAAGPENGGKVLEMLRERGISYYPKHKVREIGERAVTFEEGVPLTFDLLICVPPHRAPRPVVEAGLTDESGWIPVDPSTLQTKEPDIYAVGDITLVPTPHGYVPFLPKAGVFAHGQAKVVAHNISGEIKGRARPKSWDGQGACFLEVSQDKSAYLKGNFLAEPHPELDLRPPSRVYHTQKILFEKYWMRHWLSGRATPKESRGESR
jgi:sulfide:quinone oxidoreductase